MDISVIQSLVDGALEAGDTVETELYADHCAEHLGELGELLCLAIIGADAVRWSGMMAVAQALTPELASALDAIERHINRERVTFTAKRAQEVSDANEFDMQCRAELDGIMRRSA